MVNGFGRVRKICKYNKQRSVVTNWPLNNNLTNYNSHDNYNENIDVGSKEPITAETYSRRSNEKNDAFCLFLAYFIHFLAENNSIFEPLFPLNFGIIISDLFEVGEGCDIIKSQRSLSLSSAFRESCYLRANFVSCCLQSRY